MKPQRVRSHGGTVVRIVVTPQWKAATTARDVTLPLPTIDNEGGDENVIAFDGARRRSDFAYMRSSDAVDGGSLDNARAACVEEEEEEAVTADDSSIIDAIDSAREAMRAATEDAFVGDRLLLCRFRLRPIGRWDGFCFAIEDRMGMSSGFR